MAPTSQWLDRLMAVRSRRDFLGLATLGLAAVTLPVGRSRLLPADSGDPCEVGCLYYYGKAVYYADLAACGQSWRSSASYAFFASLVPLPGTAALVDKVRRGNYLSCRDQAVLSSKAHSYDCTKAGCPGFDPKAKGPDGPCASCSQNCCPCPQVQIGFICCFYDCNDPNHSCC
jgi:hypothetical protein